jgi:BASS family bile acid:Na+ symporter
MGATLTLESFRDIARRPRSILVGLLAQFLWTPLLAFTLALTLGASPAAAIGLVVVGSCPGGTTSSMYTYLAKGDLALSISMTALTTIGSLVAMPALLFLYATPFTNAALRIPYINVIQVLAITLVPVALGMLVRKVSPRRARQLEKVGSIAGALVVALLTLSMLVRNRGEAPSITTAEWISALLLGVGGLLLGHITARGAGLAAAEQRAIAIEVAVQNSALALGVVVTSFPAQLAHDMSRVIVLYAIFTTFSVGVAALLYRRASTPVTTGVRDQA